LQKAHDGAALSEYAYSYALYLLLKNGFDGPDSSTFGPGTRDDYLRVARHLIAHLKRGGNVGKWVFTDQGQFHIEAYITAGNGLAWYLYESAAGDIGKLEEALAIAQRASAHASSEQHYYVRDTEVRILLALGRHDEAYGIVRDVLEEVPDFGDFADLQQDPAYRQWRDAQ
jgi:tetratricopeptide (TPR) repeat protein